MRGYLRIGGAVAFGVVVVLVAFYLRAAPSGGVASDGGVVVSGASVRPYIEPKDTNGDGVPDWQADASAVEHIPAPEPVAEATDSKPYTSPTTVTGKFSEYLFTKYMEGKMYGTLDTKSLMSNAVAVVDKSTGSKLFSRLSIHEIPDSGSALKTYGNRVAEIVGINTPAHEHELMIFKRALDTRDQTVLAELTPIQESYDAILNNLLKMDVPKSMVPEHQNLVNSYKGISDDVSGMQKIFEDPLFTLGRLKQYQNNAEGLYNAYKSIITKLDALGITFDSDEYGKYLYMFEV